MLRNRLYYLLKPWLPRRFRMLLRRVEARRALRGSVGSWPILDSAGRKPDGWPGWPEGKQFAVVLTHDVESQVGVNRVRQLAELEMSLGFRSSFNFIPEGDYRVPTELREWLTANGFEVGVHDHRHDGKLYQSREHFRRSADRINGYLKEWNAAGFRSGFMLHNLDWIHDLHIAYDASTFDTDPFEPQPDGVGTIFPFWVPTPGAQSAGRRAQGAPSSREGSPDSGLPAPDSAGQRGYVELPYTLVQDSTLFFLLKAKSPVIWIQKADWVAERGGMVLLNLHPDYIRFGSEPDAFDAERYREFLRHLKQKHSGAYWHRLPREVAAWVRGHRIQHTVRRPLRVAMVAHSFYEHDGRIMRYAESLAQRGDHVEVLALKAGRDLPTTEPIQSVVLTRLHPRLSGDRAGRLKQLLSVALFTCTAGFVLAWRHFRRRYDVIHVHNIPDFLVFAAWLPRLLGAKVILDIHDLVPELYGNKFKSSDESSAVRWLRRVEGISCRHSDHVIISNDLWRKVITERSVTSERCSVFVNHVDPAVFFQHPRQRKDDRFVLMFPGSLQWHQGLDIAIRAFRRVSAEIPKAEFHIYGGGPAKPELELLARELGLDGRVRFLRSVPIRDMPRILADADIGVVPKRADSFGDQAYSTKIMEFMSQGVPLVISRTRIDSFYFTSAEVTFFESGNDEELANRILELLRDPERRKRQAANGLEYVDRNSWDRKRQVYFDLVDGLVDAKREAHSA